MKKVSQTLTVLLLSSVVVSSVFATENRSSTQNEDYELEKVLIFSRHGLRSPVRKDPQRWQNIPRMRGRNGMCHQVISRQKGTVLETYFGQYLGQWLADKGLLTTERCASGEGIFCLCECSTTHSCNGASDCGRCFCRM